MNLIALKENLRDEPKYRYQQVNKLAFSDFISSWDEATTLPKTLREKLATNAPLNIEYELLKGDETASLKALIYLADGARIETVLMQHNDGRNTICLSSQVGCPLGCIFCATGQNGFARNLTISEIITQVLFFGRYLKSRGEKITNLVFMGMGEPFLNYDNVLGAIKIINDPEFFNIGARHISISTAGIVEGIKKLGKEKMQLNLALSLHAADNKLRSQLMPINEKQPLEKVLKAIENYQEKTNRRVMFEYIMLNGINDQPEQARELASKITNKKLTVINLIKYNETGEFKPSTPGRIKAFREVLEKNRLSVTSRQSYGGEIQAACGQLAANKRYERN